MKQNTIYQELCTELQRAQRRRHRNARTNPIADSALRLAQRVERGEIKHDQIAELTECLAESLLQKRSGEWAKALSHEAKSANDGEQTSLIARLSKLRGFGDDQDYTFEEFAALWSRPRFGVVFTGHPTFALGATESDRLAELIIQKLGENEDQMVVEGSSDRPNSKITLLDEHQAMLVSVMNFRQATRDLSRQVLRSARKKFPSTWHKLLPHPVAGATWVGYDLDGRADIFWQQALALRVKEKRMMLARVCDGLDSLAKRRTAADVRDKLQPLIARYRKFETLLENFGDALIASSTTSARLEQDAKNFSNESEGVHPHHLVQQLQDLASTANSDDSKEELILWAVEINAFGFGVSEIHLRVNAVQVHNGIRNELNINFDRTQRRRNLKRLGNSIHDVEPETVDFDTIEKEQSTVRRQMMLARIIIKYLDGDTPIRFLIAECEDPITLLAALYLARRFGLEDRLDISPLMETPRALERGAMMVEKALSIKEWRNYIRRRRRLCLQTGYSDAGRYIGQPAAALAIERLHIKIAHSAKKYIGSETEVVIFNTHGESMGRGAYPYDFRRRQNYIFSPYARRAFIDAGLTLRHEISFQGGDGFVLFKDSRLVCRVLNHLLAIEHEPDFVSASGTRGNLPNDDLYSDTDSSLDFFLSLKNWQQQMFHNEDYAKLLNAYGTNMLVETGSRRVRRASQTQNDRAEMSRLRAIPHNAILQQLGYIVHVCGGIGTAGLQDPEGFLGMLRKSPRLNLILQLALLGLDKSSLETVEAYADPVDANFWMKRAFFENADSSEICSRIGGVLLEDGRAAAMRRVVTLWQEDVLRLRSLNALGSLSLSGKVKHVIEMRTPEGLDVLHVLRISLIMITIGLAARVPPFSQNENFNRRDVLDAASRMDTRHVCDLIRTAFPVREHHKQEEEIAGDEYLRIEHDISQPIEAYGHIFRRLGVLTSHVFGAYG